MARSVSKVRETVSKPIAQAGGSPTKGMAFGDDARARFAGKNYVGDQKRPGGGVMIGKQCRPGSPARGEAYAGDDIRPERMGKSKPSSHDDFEAREKAFPQNVDYHSKKERR